VYYLFSNSLIFNSLLLSFVLLIFEVYFFLRNIVNIFIGISMGNIFGLVFNSVIVGISLFVGNNFYFLNSLIFDVVSFIRNIFDSAFSFDVGLLRNDGSDVFLSWGWGFDIDLTGLDDGLLDILNFWLNNCLLDLTWLLVVGDGS